MVGTFYYRLARRRPAQVKERIVAMAAAQAGPGCDARTHFAPRYAPWDQRVCLVPDGDLFAEIRAGRAEVVTDTIERFVPDGIRLASGATLPADVVVVATGLEVELLGGIAISVDGAPVNPADHINYKGMLLSDVPNLVLSFGYTNASWTLKSDLTARYFCRLLNHMGAHDLAICVPRLPPEGVERMPMLDFSSGYVARAEGMLPGQGATAPWRLYQNYYKDLAALGLGTVTDGVMEFRKAG
jgi:cyclohexanone monooxygenase